MTSIRRMALAGMMAAFGAGAWFVLEHGPETVAVAKEETVKAVIAKKGLAPAEQEALMGRFRAQYPKVSQKLEAWTPVTAAKLEALHDAYRTLPASERQAIAQDVSQWQRQVWEKYPAIRQTWNVGGLERERNVAETALDLPATDRQKLDTSVNGLWKTIETKHPQWASQVDAILRAQ